MSAYLTAMMEAPKEDVIRQLLNKVDQIATLEAELSRVRGELAQAREIADDVVADAKMLYDGDLCENGETVTERAWRVKNEQIKELIAELSSAKEVLERLPVSADGKPLMLGDDVFVNKALAEKYYDAGYGKRRPSDHHGEVFEVMVCGLGNLGDPNRRAGFLEPLMSFSISIDLRAVFSTREAALASRKSTADPSDKE